MSNFKFEAIIFDMDGLLVDSETIWEEAELEVLSGYGVDVSGGRPEGLTGLRMDAFTAALVKKFNLSVDPVRLGQEIIDRTNELLIQKVQPQPGAPEMVQFVIDRSIPRAIASSSPLSVIETVLRSQGWTDAISQRLSADSVPNGKPAPDVYLGAAEMIGVKPTDCLALEDSTNGARAAVAAQMTCIAVPDTAFHAPADFADITPHIFNSLHDVLEQLR